MDNCHNVAISLEQQLSGPEHCPVVPPDLSRKGLTRPILDAEEGASGTEATVAERLPDCAALVVAEHDVVKGRVPEGRRVDEDAAGRVEEAELPAAGRLGEREGCAVETWRRDPGREQRGFQEG